MVECLRHKVNKKDDILVSLWVNKRWLAEVSWLQSGISFIAVRSSRGINCSSVSAAGHRGRGNYITVCECGQCVTSMLQQDANRHEDTYWFTWVNWGEVLFEFLNSPVKSTLNCLVTNLLIRCFHHQSHRCQVVHCGKNWQISNRH